MTELLYKYKIHGLRKGRKNNKFINYDFFKESIINLKKDIKKNKKIILDIGSGSGENSLFLAKKNPKSLIIACDVFQDGNINLCNYLFKSKLNNVRLFNSNVIKLFDLLKADKYFDEIWLLFPDPWPKNRHHKRRLIETTFFKISYPLLKSQGKIFIATDSVSYLNSILNSIYKIKSFFKWQNDRPQYWNYKIQDLPQTKFYKKAQNLDRFSFFIELVKI